MSLDLFVYSPSAEPITAEALCSELGTSGWYSDLAGAPTRSARLQAPLPEYALLWATRDEDVGIRVTALLDAQNDKGVGALAGQEVIAACEVYVHLNYKPFDGYDEDQRKDIETSLAPAVLARMRAAKTEYYLRTSAGRSAASSCLQFATWKAIARLTEGLLDEPQSGRHGAYVGDRIEVLDGGDDEDGADPVFIALARHGFPIDESDPLLGKQLRMEQFSIAEMDRLLAVMEKEVDPGYRAMVAPMLIDEFGLYKGREFCKSHKSWFDHARSRFTPASPDSPRRR